MSGLAQIVTPATNTALVSLGTARYDLGDPAGDDAYITDLINRASSIVAVHCGRPFGLQTITETFRPTMSHRPPRSLLLTFTPVVGITSVTAGNTTLTADTDYECDPATGELWRLYGTQRSSWLHSPVAVSYTAGYALPDDQNVVAPALPSALQEVTLSLVRSAYYARGNDPRLVMEIVEGVGRNTYQAPTLSGMQIDDANAAILSRFKVRSW